MKLTRAVPRQVVPYIEPKLVRHAVARRRVWLLRDDREAGYGVDEFYRQECIFFHIPKTAGLAISDTLFGSPGAGHIDVATAKMIFGSRGFAAFFKFAFVRNPWDRLVSAFHYLRSGHPTSPIAADVQKCRDFEEFVVEKLRTATVATELHIRPQYTFVTDWRGTVAVDFVGRFERLEGDFGVIAERLRVQQRLPRRNMSRHDDYRTYYSPRTRDIVGDFYRHDVELFGYTFDGWEKGGMRRRRQRSDWVGVARPLLRRSGAKR